MITCGLNELQRDCVALAVCYGLLSYGNEQLKSQAPPTVQHEYIGHKTNTTGTIVQENVLFDYEVGMPAIIRLFVTVSIIEDYFLNSILFIYFFINIYVFLFFFLVWFQPKYRLMLIIVIVLGGVSNNR